MENSVKDLYQFLLDGINEANNSLATEEYLLNYWNNQYEDEHQVNLILNFNNKIASLKFRLEWLETQLTSVRETYGKK